MVYVETFFGLVGIATALYVLVCFVLGGLLGWGDDFND